MDFLNNIGVGAVAVITVICYLLAMGLRATRMDNKWIPVACGAMGGCLGVAAMWLMPDYPATDYITAVAVGIVSGLAAVGVNQIGKQLGK